MASDELNKKWGTVFMGAREADMDELATMQQPHLQERQKQQRQQDYMESVRARATERAREILAAVYIEREKILEEARREGQELSLQFCKEADNLKASAAREYAEAANEREAASALRREAQNLHDAAQKDGFQSGMEQAEEDLKKFRAELGTCVIALLRAIQSQQRVIADFWREELVDLVRVAVAAGVGWILRSEHEAVLRTLVLNSLDKLVVHSALHVRVHPQDEAQVGGMFAVAQERTPDLKQWTVSADANLEQGDFTLESVYGSVENRRQYFREMVDGILAGLVLPAGVDGVDQISENGEGLSDLVDKEVAKITALDIPLEPESETSEFELEFTEVSPTALSPGLAMEKQEIFPVEAEIVQETVFAQNVGQIPPTEIETGGRLFPDPPNTAGDVIAGKVKIEQGSTAPTVNSSDIGLTAPTIAELEDELFPQDAQDMQNTPNISQSSDQGANLNTAKVFNEGGFLPVGKNHES